MGEQDQGILQIHLEDPDISGFNMLAPSANRVLLPAEARATRYGKYSVFQLKFYAVLG